MYFIGQPWAGHARHSGYEAFCGEIGVKLWRPTRRELPFGWVGLALDRAVGRLVGRRYYTLCNLLTELYACLHVLLWRRSRHHVLYADSDTVLLPRLLRRVRRPVSATVHLPEHRLPAGFSYDDLDVFDKVVFLAAAHERAAGPRLRRAESVVIEHPVDTAFFCPEGTPPCAARRPRRVLSVGGHLRDFRTLAAAAAMLFVAGLVDELALVGVPESQRSLFAQLDGARFYDDIDDEKLRRLYRESDVVALSLHDAYANNALLEAMACGCAIAVTEVGAVSEYLRNAGLYVRKGDPDHLAGALLQLLSSPAQAAELGRAARARALELSIPRTAARFAAALDA